MHTKVLPDECNSFHLRTGKTQRLNLNGNVLKAFFRCKIISNTQIENYRRKTLDSSFKGVVFSYLSQVLYINNLNRKNFTYLIAKEQFVTNQLVFYFQRNHYMTDRFNKKIYTLHEAGLIQNLVLKYMDSSHMLTITKASKAQPAKPLEFRRLSGIFSVWACLLLLSIVVFIFEHLWSYKRHRKVIHRTK